MNTMIQQLDDVVGPRLVASNLPARQTHTSNHYITPHPELLCVNNISVLYILSVDTARDIDMIVIALVCFLYYHTRYIYIKQVFVH
jgi:hypothetical protein